MLQTGKEALGKCFYTSNIIQHSATLHGDGECGFGVEVLEKVKTT